MPHVIALHWLKAGRAGDFDQFRIFSDATSTPSLDIPSEIIDRETFDMIGLDGMYKGKEVLLDNEPFSEE